MARILAIDYGQKRVGIAVTDNLQIIATGLDTVPAKDIFQYLKKYCQKENVELIVVGLPKDLQNNDTDATAFVEAFVHRLSKIFPHIPVEKIDERFTSKIAFRAMVEGGMKKSKRRNKETIDKISAVVILQSYLEAKNNKINK